MAMTNGSGKIKRTRQQRALAKQLGVATSTLDGAPPGALEHLRAALLTAPPGTDPHDILTALVNRKDREAKANALLADLFAFLHESMVKYGVKTAGELQRNEDFALDFQRQSEEWERRYGMTPEEAQSIAP